MVDEKKITKDTTFGEMLNLNEDAREILADHGLGCGACPMSSFETLEQGALTHGIDPEELLKNLKEDFEEG
jgi:hybrid cluster-associated redox disulfide protein|tara:strand:+ start:1580 stop:1792 length:213 start_codon:yes stop_codon:yes gene_type:complete